MPSLRTLLSSPAPDAGAIATLLDQLGPSTRLAEVMDLGRREQARLFDAVAGARQLGVGDLVPASLGSMNPVVHEGRNSLPAFKRFAKVMCRADDTDAELWGYNRNPQTVEVTVGPGYFVAYPYRDGEVLIDYTRVPPRAPAGWPKIVSNASRLSRFVYNGTQDVLRGVSDHVTIGRATRGGKPMDNWFVLCRIDS